MFFHFLDPPALGLKGLGRGQIGALDVPKKIAQLTSGGVLLQPVDQPHGLPMEGIDRQPHTEGELRGVFKERVRPGRSAAVGPLGERS
ncbi:MAG TPA: hypothetical protein VN648_11825, partial [Candidatus Methylomirabilis sp.]|nr:hypothetical protein [Candidatus Methylomirabilis sp.]